MRKLSGCKVRLFVIFYLPLQPKINIYAIYGRLSRGKYEFVVQEDSNS